MTCCFGPSDSRWRINWQLRSCCDAWTPARRLLRRNMSDFASRVLAVAATQAGVGFRELKSTRCELVLDSGTSGMARTHRRSLRILLGR